MGSGADVYNQAHFYFSFYGKPDSGFLQAFLDSLVSTETWTVLSTRADTIQMWSDWLIMMFKAVKAIGDVLRLYCHWAASALFNLYQNKQRREGRRHNAYQQRQMLRQLETTRRILSGLSLFCFRGPSGQGAPALLAECTHAVKHSTHTLSSRCDMKLNSILKGQLLKKVHSLPYWEVCALRNKSIWETK